MKNEELPLMLVTAGVDIDQGRKAYTALLSTNILIGLSARIVYETTRLCL